MISDAYQLQFLVLKQHGKLSEAVEPVLLFERHVEVIGRPTLLPGDSGENCQMNRKSDFEIELSADEAWWYDEENIGHVS